MKTINELSMTEYDPNFRKFFKKVIIKSRTDLTFIIGNENVENLDLLNLPKVLNSNYQIKVRAQLYNVDFGIYFIGKRHPKCDSSWFGVALRSN